MSTAGPEPLNPALFRVLNQRFEPVHIAHEGEPWVERTGIGIGGKTQKVVASYGEVYRVNCPFCGDKRQRLWITHRFGTARETGQRFLKGTHCFNENCTEDYHNVLKLDRLLFGHMNVDERRKFFVVKKGKVSATQLGPAQLPGLVIPLDQMTEEDLAVRYVKARGFDVEELTERFQVGYCAEPDIKNQRCLNRLICPIYRGTTLVGWQARALRDDVKPKYITMTGFKKNRWLYNHTMASQSRVVVVVEGVTDVWKVGPAGVALLGKTMSPQQKELLVSWARRDGLLVMMLDPDAADNTRQLCSELSGVFHGRALSVVLPDGADPGSLSRDAIWGSIASACADAGFELAPYLVGADVNSIGAN